MRDRERQRETERGRERQRKVIIVRISKGARKLLKTNVKCKDHFCDKAPPAVRGIVIRFIPTLPIFHFRPKKFSFVGGQSLNGWM